MNLKTPLGFGACLFAGLLFGIGTVVEAAEYDRNLEKAFQTISGGKLIVRADQGSIEINSKSGDNVRVRVLRRVKGGSQAQADELFANHEVTFSQEGNTVSIVGRNKKDRFRPGSFRRPNMQVRYEISSHRCGNALRMAQRQTVKFQAEIGYDDTSQNRERQISDDRRNKKPS